MAKDNAKENTVTKSEDEFSNLLGQLETLLKSATDDAPDEASEGSSAPAEPDMSADSQASASDPVDAAAAAPSDATPGVSETGAAAAAAPEGSPGHEGGEIEPAATVEGLAAEYAKLDPEALKMHYLACKQVLMAAMGGGAGGAPDMGAPPAAPPAPAEASASAPAPAMKSESAMMLEALKLMKAELEASKKQQDEVLAELAEAFAAPVRKSVQNLADIKPVEKPKKKVSELTKSECEDILIEKARQGKLSKADAKLANRYTFGDATKKDIEHLLGE